MPKKNEEIISFMKRINYDIRFKSIKELIEGDYSIFYNISYDHCISFLDGFLKISEYFKNNTDDDIQYEYNCYSDFIQKKVYPEVIKDIKNVDIYEEKRKKDLKLVVDYMAKLMSVYGKDINKKELYKLIDAKKVLPNPYEETQTCSVCSIS